MILRHIDIEPQPVNLRDGEHRLLGAAVAGIHQVAVVDIAPRHNAVERSHHLAEALLFQQAFEYRLGLPVCGKLFVIFLLRNSILFAQPGPALVGGLRELEIRPGLIDLLVDFRDIERRQQLALLHGLTDVLEPLLHIAAGARIYLCLVNALQGTRQRQPGFMAAGAWLDDTHLQDIACRGPRGQHLGVCVAQQQHAAKTEQQQCNHGCGGQACDADDPGAILFLRVVDLVRFRRVLMFWALVCHITS